MNTLWRYALAFSIAVAAHGLAYAQEPWTPRRNVEIVTGGAGGSQDRVVRLMQKLMQKMVPVATAIVNKVGGGGNVALLYTVQPPADGHRVLLVTPTFLTNYITGVSTIGPADVSPLVTLFSEHLGVYVKADSPIKTGADLVNRLKANPQSLSIAIGTNLGNLNHMSLVKVLRGAGMSTADIQKLKTLAFKGSEHLPALLGGHIDALVLTLSTMVPHIQTGELRAIAVSAPQRLSGPVAAVPTWKELGYDVTLSAWRAMIGGKGVDTRQAAWWEAVLSRVAESPEWKKEIEASYWSEHFRGSAATRTHLEAEQAEMRALLAALGMAGAK